MEEAAGVSLEHNFSLLHPCSCPSLGQAGMALRLKATVLYLHQLLGELWHVDYFGTCAAIRCGLGRVWPCLWRRLFLQLHQDQGHESKAGSPTLAKTGRGSAPEPKGRSKIASVSVTLHKYALSTQARLTILQVSRHVKPKPSR